MNQTEQHRAEILLWLCDSFHLVSRELLIELLSSSTSRVLSFPEPEGPLIWSFHICTCDFQSQPVLWHTSSRNVRISSQLRILIGPVRHIQSSSSDGEMTWGGFRARSFWCLSLCCFLWRRVTISTCSWSVKAPNNKWTGCWTEVKPSSPCVTVNPQRTECGKSAVWLEEADEAGSSSPNHTLTCLIFTDENSCPPPSFCSDLHPNAESYRVEGGWMLRLAGDSGLVGLWARVNHNWLHMCVWSH